MVMTKDEAKRRANEIVNSGMTGMDNICDRIAEALLQAVEEARKEAIEECAKCAERHLVVVFDNDIPTAVEARNVIAKSIRNLANNKGE